MESISISIKSSVLDNNKDENKSSDSTTTTDKYGASNTKIEYTTKIKTDGGEITFDKKVYIVYPEVWRVLTIFGGTDMTKEEVLKVAENTTLVPTGETVPLSETFCFNRCGVEPRSAPQVIENK